MSNNCTTNHAIMFFFLLSFLLVYNHDFFSFPSKSTKSTKSRSRNSPCSCNCPATTAAVASPADPTIILFLSFFSGVLFTLLCILTIRFPAIFIAPARSTVLLALDFVHRIKRIRSSPPPPQSVGRHHSPAATGGGISDSLLKTLPIFEYSAEKRPNFGKEAGLCAICLSEFLSEQTLRWLPDCDHLFHRGCIDTWLQSNKTCPCCRANVERGGGEIMLLENGENSAAPEIGSSFRRFSDGDGGRDLDDRRRVGCERSVVSGLIRVLMGRRRHQGNRLRHR